MSERGQLSMVHRLPRAHVVDRIGLLIWLARGRRVVHVGFVDSGYRNMQERSQAWLHDRLARVAEGLVGLDVDEDGVARARSEGYEAFAVDCRDPDALTALGLDAAEVVIAGEVIEHLDDPGAFLDGLHALVGPGGLLVLTTPNAHGLFNVVAGLINREVNHPDHVVAFTWRTLTTLLERHRWQPTRTWTYVPVVKDIARADAKDRVVARGARVVLGIERLVGQLGAPFLADGLVVAAHSVATTSSGAD